MIQYFLYMYIYSYVYVVLFRYSFLFRTQPTGISHTCVQIIQRRLISNGVSGPSSFLLWHDPIEGKSLERCNVHVQSCKVVLTKGPCAFLFVVFERCSDPTTVILPFVDTSIKNTNVSFAFVSLQPLRTRQPYSPHALAQSRQRTIPQALLNAALSERPYDHWRVRSLVRPSGCWMSYVAFVVFFHATSDATETQKGPMKAVAAQQRGAYINVQLFFRHQPVTYSNMSSEWWSSAATKLFSQGF